jgi:hypothetical protein
MNTKQNPSQSWAKQKLLWLLLLLMTPAISPAQVVISGYLANPAGTDSPYEYVQLKATQAINFATTNYSVVFNNNGTVSSNGWAGGGAVSYKFNLTSGSVAQGEVFYVGGSGKLINGVSTLDISTETWIRVINTGTTAGDGFGNLNTGGVLGNAGTTADGIAVFNTTTVTGTTVPVDAIFYGSALGSIVPGSGGYVMPNNDRYSNATVMGSGTNTFLFTDPSGSGAYTKLTGTYNTTSGLWTTPRTSTIITNPTLLSQIASGITLNAGSPTISVNTALFNGAFGSVITGNSSASSSFTVEGSSLTDNITITPPAGGFEIRTGVNAFSTAPIVLTQSGGIVSQTTIDVRFSPLAAGPQSGNINCTSTGASTVNVPASGTGVAPTPPVKLKVVSVNAGASLIVAAPFNVIVNAVDNSDVPQNVTANTTVQLSVNTGTGSLGGTFSGIMTAGTSQVTITGATYAPAETGVILSADAIAGDVLTSGLSNTFNVLDTASFMFLNNFPTSALVSTNLSSFTVQARRADNSIDFNYVGTFTITKASGPGNLTGTTSKPAVNGVASFTDLQFDAPGSYTLKVSSGFLPDLFSNSIVITLPPVLTELVVPKYMGAKTGASTNNARTPIAVCLQLDNLLPLTTYDVKVGLGLTSEASTVIGAGNVWNGTAFLGSDALGAFTTDINGSSGPFWAYVQPTGNGTRFDAGQIHNLRLNFVPTGNTLNTTPKVVGSKTITALDIATAARTVSTADDGAFYTGSSYDCTSGKYVLVYDNTAGSGDPLYSYMATATIPVNTTQSDLPAAINSFYLQSGSSAGNFGGVIPIGANNPNGVRRVEVRNADNTIFGSETDADGVWASGANTTTVLRRGIAALTLSDTPFSNASAALSGSTTICAGGSANLTLTFTGDAPWTYSINGDAPVVTSNNPETVVVSPASTTVYTVTSVSDAECSGPVSGSATITVDSAPPASSCTISTMPTSGCVGNTVLVATNVVPNATGYTWSVPPGSLVNGVAGPVTTATNSANITLGSVPANASGWEICVFASNACGVTNTNCKYIRGVLSLPAPIAGSTNACPNTNGNYSTAAVTGAASYAWSITGDATVSGTGTSATVTFGPTFTSGTLCVRAELACGYQGPQRCLTITNGVGTLGLMTGSFAVCPGQSGLVYSIPPVTNASSYTWSVPANISIVSGQGTNSVTVNAAPGFTLGNICVTATSPCGIVSAPRCKTISSTKPGTPGNITGAATGVCNTTVTYTVPAVAGITSYTWSAPAGASIISGQGTNSVDVSYSNGFTTGQLCVTANNACGSSTARCISVKGAPAIPGIISGPATVCAGEQGLVYSIAGVFGASTYNWVVPAGATIVAGQNTTSIVVDWGNASGSVTVNASNGCGSSGTRTLLVAVNCRLAGTATAELNIYPVPVNDKMNIVLAEAGQYQITLQDLSGRVLITENNKAVGASETVTINVGQLAAGIYMVTVTSDSGKTYNQKIVVE